MTDFNTRMAKIVSKEVKRALKSKNLDIDLRLLRVKGEAPIITLKKNSQTFYLGKLMPDEALGFIAHKLFRAIDREDLYQPYIAKE